MVPPNLKAREAIAAIRRRWKLILIPTVLVTALSAIGVHYQPKKYESSTTILIRPNRTLTQVPGYAMGMAYEEEMRNFNEILWSRTVLQALADSLGLTAGARTETDRQAVGTSLSHNFHTALGSGFFRIYYLDTDPGRAQRAAQVLANLFIQTKTSVEERQSELTVQFYEKKVQEYRDVFEASVQSWVSAMKQNVDELPLESRSLYNQVDEIQRRIAATDTRIQTNRHALEILKTLPEKIQSNPEVLYTDAGERYLLDLVREDLPYVADLRALRARFDEVSRRYTPQHPDVQKLEDQIADHLVSMRKALESEIANLQSEHSDLEKKRTQLIDDLKQSSALTKMNKDKESSFEMNRRMYDEMQLKLEQARLAREVTEQGATQYFMIDPAYYPTGPAKTKQTLIAAAFGLGLLLGILSAVAAELFDTTVRKPSDIEVYEKPVIALLPDAQRR